ncbi:hypothetical protein [Gryllotalpicola protaetiae]|uniref:Phage tail assembly protein n=1 Tax=Gryllotalpicola protaetiae TaxID=2419771 RepID=A0A387BI56_9MICO|nr:hypothetical protein [Gryllotalpicola protaetiae]AYG02368.1 hypothetical protein D7I44_01680 [Gryllotalpicola protaetiae]
MTTDSPDIIVVPDYEPSGKTVRVRLPGMPKPVTIPDSDDVVNLEMLDGFQAGNFKPLVNIFPPEAQAAFRALRPKQIAAFIDGWTGGQGKSVSSPTS